MESADTEEEEEGEEEEVEEDEDENQRGLATAAGASYARECEGPPRGEECRTRVPSSTPG